jgi:ABC-type multidrug transport system ATPase subunit
MNNTMLTLSNISMIFKQSDVEDKTVLTNLNLDILNDKWYYLIGENGSGKSTILKVIVNELAPTVGSVVYKQIQVKDICFIEQEISKNLVLSMTVFENMIIALSAFSKFKNNLSFYHRKDSKEKCKEILSEYEMGIETQLNKQVKYLSSGQQQALVIATALCKQPKLILADEFTSALDYKVAPNVLKIMFNYKQQTHCSIISISHNKKEIIESAEIVLNLRNGTVEIVTDVSGCLAR